MRFYLPLLLLGFAFGMQAQDPATVNLRSVAQPNQRVSIYNETAINSTASDFSPSFYGDTLVFCSARHAGPKDPATGESFFDFYFAPIGPNGSLRSPKPFSINLNSAQHEGQSTFDLKANKVYFTRNNTTNGVEPVAADGKIRMKIYEATFGFLDWEQIRPLPFNSDTYNCMHPTLSHDGTFMIFSSNRPGGKGGYDLYVSLKMDGGWSPPMNLGGRINTPGHEFFPFLHQSGTLFFTSDGYKKGYGGYDLYMVEGKGDGSWAEVVNLGEPFNTDADDFGLILDEEGKSGYFSSNREGGVGRDDIYSFDAPEGIQGVVFPDFKTTTIDVFTEEGRRPVSGAEIKIYERVIGSTGNIQYLRLPRASIGMGRDGQAQIDQRSEDLEEPDEVTNSEGKAYIMLDVSKEYRIKVEKRGFFAAEEYYMPSDNRFNRPVGIPLKRDDCITLEGEVKNVETRASIAGATILIFNQEEQRRVTISSDERGVFKYCLPDGFRFIIVGSLVGFENDTTYVQTVNRRGNRSLGASLALKPLPVVPRSGGFPQSGSYEDTPAPSLGDRSAVEVGSRFLLDNLQFEFASAGILEEAAADLRHLAKLMRENPGMRVELRAYTDCVGGEEYNRKLSLRRAEAARDFLVQLGIKRDRILALGYGELNPVVDCDCDGTGGSVPCTESMHARNRRTEVAIIGK
ncbi:OmpA family protein [Phaeodactylibacter xiamenensis]|uniref:OmpA family protein n=1 Tax=Phaeodactylibacter xiamenensis TaxID=1524460 RepID=UPI003CCC45E1